MRLRHSLFLLLSSALLIAATSMCGTATAQVVVPLVPGGGGVVMQGEGAVLYGEGAFLRGMGCYNLNTAAATSINVDTVTRWKKDLRNDQLAHRELMERNAAGKKQRIEEVKKHQRIRESRLRLNPTSDEIQNGLALNALLYDLADPDIESNDWASKAIELPKDVSIKDLIFRFTPLSKSTSASKALSRGVIALSRLDVAGNKWPTVLKQKELDSERLAYEQSYAKLRSQLISDKFDVRLLMSVDQSLDNLKSKVETEVPKERGFRDEGLKYVSELTDATRMFDAATVEYSREILIDTNNNDAKTVGELVGFMLKYRLQFASAEKNASGRALYRQIFDALQKQANALGIKPSNEAAAK